MDCCLTLQSLTDMRGNRADQLKAWTLGLDLLSSNTGYTTKCMTLGKLFNVSVCIMGVIMIVPASRA